MSLSTDEQLSILMDLNKLSYSPPIDGSMITQSRLRKYAFQPLNYDSGQTAQLTINSGSDFISGPSSFIRADLSFKGTAGETLKWNSAAGGPGSAFNIFSEFQISHRSGDVLDRTDRINVLVGVLVKYASVDYSQNISGLFDYGSSANLPIGAGGAYGVTVPYVFPLFMFSGLFAQKSLIPSQILAGSTCKMQLEDKLTAMVHSAGNLVGDYKVTNMYLVLHSSQLFDAGLKQLLSQAANVRTQGLQFPYYSWFHLATQESSANLNFDINYSAAKSQILLIKARTTANLTTKNLDSMASKNYDYSKWRMRIGALTMPEYEIDAARESYCVTVQSMGEAQDCDLNQKNYNKTGASYAEYAGSHAIVAQSLEKSTITSLNSGTVTNNSMLLNFTAVLNTFGTAVTYDAYLRHLRVCNAMLDNVVVDR